MISLRKVCLIDADQNGPDEWGVQVELMTGISSFSKGPNIGGLTVDVHRLKTAVLLMFSSSFLELFVGVNRYCHHC